MAELHNVPNNQWNSFVPHGIRVRVLSESNTISSETENHHRYIRKQKCSAYNAATEPKLTATWTKALCKPTP
ncbi:hypothetical protein J6590_077051 [Homalodisca vitripennis]|nr:hypothetical protein J6590_077051 [Homalodisca vitripennis]